MHRIIFWARGSCVLHIDREMNAVLSAVLQVLVGLVIVWCIFLMSLWILRKDKLVADRKVKYDSKDSFKVVDGYAETSIAANRVWNTVDASTKNFARLLRSYNRKGGAQYSYSYWLKLNDTTPENVANKTILLRGDIREYTYETTVRSDDGITRATEEKVNHAGVVIKGPRIMFGPTYDSLVVEFNTLDNPNERVFIQSFAALGGDVSLRQNVLKLIKSKWALFTFTFEDNVAINDFEDGIVFKFFINDLQYHTVKVRSTLRQNNGNFYLLPTSSGAIKDARIGDVMYHNYALSPVSVRDIFRAGPPKHVATDIMGLESQGSPLHLSTWNALDIYNT